MLWKAQRIRPKVRIPVTPSVIATVLDDLANSAAPSQYRLALKGLLKDSAMEIVAMPRRELEPVPLSRAQATSFAGSEAPAEDEEDENGERSERGQRGSVREPEIHEGYAEQETAELSRAGLSTFEASMVNLRGIVSDSVWKKKKKRRTDVLENFDWEAATEEAGEREVDEQNATEDIVAAAEELVESADEVGQQVASTLGWTF